MATVAPVISESVQNSASGNRPSPFTSGSSGAIRINWTCGPCGKPCAKRPAASISGRVGARVGSWGKILKTSNVFPSQQLSEITI